MPRNQFQQMIFALLTVIVTVHAYVLYIDKMMEKLYNNYNLFVKNTDNRVRFY